MEILDEKVRAFIAINFKKWEEYEIPIENIHQFKKWWFNDFLFTLPEQTEDGEDYFSINEIYTPEEFFEGNMEIFGKCIKIVHDYYTETERLHMDVILDPYPRDYDPLNIMLGYASLYVENNYDLMNLYVPLHLQDSINSSHIQPA